VLHFDMARPRLLPRHRQFCTAANAGAVRAAVARSGDESARHDWAAFPRALRQRLFPPDADTLIVLEVPSSQLMGWQFGDVGRTWCC